MSTVSTPYGFMPLYRIGGATPPSPRAFKGAISSAYATTIGKGCPVYWATDGTIALLAAGGATGCDGIFSHCEYTNAAGERKVSDYWPASTTATNTIAYVYTDPSIIYKVQCNGSLAFTAFGANADHVAGTVNTRTGRSADVLSSTLAAADAQAMFKIVGLHDIPGNAWGDTYTEVQVVIAERGNAFLTAMGSGNTTAGEAGASI